MHNCYRPLCRLLMISSVISLLLFQAQAASPNGFEVGTGPSYFSGKFGTSHPIHIYYLPVDVQYRDGAASIRVSVPYISVSGQGILSGGTVIGTGGAAGHRSGLGDIWVTGKYRFQTLDGIIPNIVPYFKLKAPTASRKMGLGTGQPDAEMGSFFQWKVSRWLFPFAQFGYRFVGRTRHIKLRSVPTYSFGSTFVVAPKRYLTFIASGHPAIQPGLKPLEDMLVAYNTSLTAKIGLQFYADKGLTKSSPAFGFGLGTTMHF